MPSVQAPDDFRYGRTRRIRKRSDFGLLRSDGIKAGATRHFTWVVRVRSAEQRETRLGLVVPPEPLETRLGLVVPPEPLETRLGLVVSTRAGNAVVRNRIKRWSREIFRHRRHELPQGLDLLLIYRPQATPTTREELEREWSRGVRFLASFAGISSGSPTANVEGAS
ncbi:MAG: ribonuclease P protein component [Polyangiaceae bacterium]